MTKAILNIWNTINKVLTVLNSFLLGILFQIGIPEQNKLGKKVKVPLVANIVLLVVLVTLLTLAIRYYARPGAPALS